MKHLPFSLIVIAFIAFSQNLFSQHKNQLVNSGEIIRASYTLNDSSKYDLAIDTLLTVDKSDTGYVATLTELAYTYMLAKKYKEAISTCNKALSYPSTFKHRLTLIKGNTLDDMGLAVQFCSIMKL